MDSEWGITSVGDICEAIYDGPHATPKKTNEGPIFLGISDLQNGQINLSDAEHLSEEDFIKWTRRVTPKQDDIVFSYETRLGEAALVPKGLKFCLGRRMALMRPNTNKVVPRFLLYAYLGPEFQQTLRAHTVRGSTVDRIPLIGFPSFPISLPPLPEQRAIAGILGALDDKIELNRRMNATLESMAQAVFRQWFVENEEVGNWEVRKLSGICSTQYGYTASASDENIGPKFLRITDMNKEPWIDWINVPYCEIGKDQLQKYKLGIGDILVSRMADPGKVGIVEEEVNAVFASYLVRLKFADLAWAYYGYYFLRSDRYLEYANGAKSGSVQSGMNARVITDVDISIPPNEKVMAFFEAIKPFRNIIVANLKESRTLASLRDSLLPKLMRGEVRVCGL
jgi:type I restriction enzyme S subunit